MGEGRKRYSTRKPYPGYPLTPRSDGRFTKRIKGRLYTFGRRGDHGKAHDEYLTIARALHTGRKQVNVSTDANLITVRQLVNRYLDVRRADVDAGDLDIRTWADYRNILTAFVRFIGHTTPAVELSAHALDRYAAHLRDNIKAGNRRFNMARAHLFAWLRHCFNAPWIPGFPLGVGFKRARRAKIRAERKNRLVAPAHCRILIDAAGPQLRAMILLGLNGAFGNTDCAELPRAAVDLSGGVIRFPRPKNGIRRAVPLWPETVTALDRVLKRRPNDRLIFRTRHGKPWVRTDINARGKPVTKDSLAPEFAKLLASVCDVAERQTLRDIYKGVGFYALRHTHITYANEVRDSDARLHIAGRKLRGTDDDYVESFFLPRLKAVTDHVHARIFSESSP
jgi:integrase